MALTETTVVVVRTTLTLRVFRVVMFTGYTVPFFTVTTAIAHLDIRFIMVVCPLFHGFEKVFIFLWNFLIWYQMKIQQPTGFTSSTG